MAAPSSSAHALGRGNAMPGRGLRLIAAVHDELQQMLQEGEGWHAKGKGWDRITSWRQDPHSYNASRLEKVVARLCGCSFWLVRKARSHSKKRNVAPMLCGGNGVAWNMQLPLMARSPPRRLLVALRHCGKEGWRRHRCSPPQHAIAWGTFEASSCHWQWKTPYSTRLA